VLTREHLEAAAARVIADGPVPLSKLARKVPADRDGRLGHASAASLVRWITKGREGVHLDGARLSGKGWCSSIQALARFSTALALAETGGPAVAAPCERERRAAAACATLDRLRAGKNWSPISG
jgi:hypothetical protein